MSTMADYLAAVARPGQTVNNLFGFLGVAVKELSPGQARLSLPLRPEFLQGAGMVAGGVLATLLDETMAHAVLPALPPDQAVTTVELSTRYLSAVGPRDLDGPPLACLARVVRQGKRIAFVEAEVSLAGRGIARASASFLIVPLSRP